MGGDESSDGRVYAYAAGTGTILWASPPVPAGIQSSPTVVNGMLFVGADDGSVYAYGL
jgi:outer membrane protein assembly factor BamB